MVAGGGAVKSAGNRVESLKKDSRRKSGRYSALALNFEKLRYGLDHRDDGIRNDEMQKGRL